MNWLTEKESWVSVLGSEFRDLTKKRENVSKSNHIDPTLLMPMGV